jgi:DNA polymerase-3 subunit beta
MKVTCNRSKFLPAFQRASAVVPARSPKPILENVRLEVREGSATLSATDLDVGICVEVEGVDAQEPGVVLLPTSRVSAILRESADEQLSFEGDANGCTIRGERSKFRLPGANPEEFPEVAVFDSEAYHEIPARLLREMIHRTVFATDNESTRYALGGLLTEMHPDQLVIVGTDGRRLSKMEGPATSIGDHSTGEGTTIVPTKAMQLIERCLSDVEIDVRLAVRANHLLADAAGTTIYANLVEGRFPRWRDVFPQRDSAVQIELPVGPLLSSVKQSAIVTSETSRGVDFAFAEGQLSLSSSSSEYGESRIELPVTYTAQAITISLDPRYVIEFLRVLDPEKTITMELENEESAALCTTDDGYAYVIMPLARDA